MKTISMIGALIVTLALISYTIAVIKERRRKQINKNVLTFFVLGIILDITATICMIIGSKNTPFTLHGFLGYSALLGMLIDTYLVWQFYRKNGVAVIVSKSLHAYTIVAYSWWVVAYITGSLLVMVK